MKRPSTLVLAALFLAVPLVVQAAAAQQRVEGVNPIFKEEKVRNYLPHMTWPEVEEALTRTDVAIIPVGSIEQHGKHLPLGTDIFAAVEVSKLIAQKTDVLVSPAVMAGISGHHMGFPGSLTLSPETFETVIFETALGLIHHGIRKIVLYNGHGGNRASVANVITRINNSTEATAVDLAEIQIPAAQSPYSAPDFDWHAGVGETSGMLFLTPSLVQMSAAENPVLTFPPAAEEARRAMSGANLDLLLSAYLFRPTETGKQAASHQISSNGVFTTGDVHTATAAQGKFRYDQLVDAAVQFIADWNGIG
ncbi:creatininase family protein [Gemmatimonadota bacterium]